MILYKKKVQVYIVLIKLKFNFEINIFISNIIILNCTINKSISFKRVIEKVFTFINFNFE